MGVWSEESQQATPAAEGDGPSAEDQSQSIEGVLLVSQVIDGPAAGKAAGEGKAGQ